MSYILTQHWEDGKETVYTIYPTGFYGKGNCKIYLEPTNDWFSIPVNGSIEITYA